jgi:hypothetical protein
MFDSLDFIYLPSRDVAAELERFISGFGAEREFAIEAFGTRVAMLRLADDSPPLLLAEHLDGDQPILVFRVGDIERAVRELEGEGVRVSARFGIPHGPAAELDTPGPQRIALYQLTRPERVKQLAGRRDF